MKKSISIFVIKDIINIVLSTIIGCLVIILMGFIAISIFFILRDINSISSYLTFSDYQLRVYLYALSLLSILPWIIISYLTYKILSKSVFNL